MNSIFLAFAVIAPICLAILVYRKLGCVAAIISFAAAVWGMTALESVARPLTKWCDEQYAEKARQNEIQKAQKAEAEREAEAQREQEEAAAAAERKRQAKVDKIQEFALKDAPKVWAAYQSLKSEVDVQDGKIEELRKTLEAFGRSPEQDEDFNRICAQRDEMIRSQNVLYAKLEDAYIAACKFAATPGRKEYGDLRKKAIEDGLREAEAAEAKFKEMRLSK